MPFNPDLTELFRQLMADHFAITYPKKAFERRLELMTKKERLLYEKKIQQLFDKIDQEFSEEVEEINEIMSQRAEIEQDKWP